MIRAAREEDLARIAEIHSDACHATYSEMISREVLSCITPESRLPVWKEWFADSVLNISVLVSESELIGFTMTCPARAVAAPPPDFAELTHLYLDPIHKGKGHGHTLFVHAVDQFKKTGFQGMLLWTLEGNSPARHFYESHNMIHDGARQDEPEWMGEGVYELRYILPFHT